MTDSFVALAKYESFCKDDAEIVEQSPWSLEDIQEIRRSFSLHVVESIDKPEPHTGMTLYDTLPDDTPEYDEETTQAPAMLQRAMDVAHYMLSADEYRIYTAGLLHQAGLRSETGNDQVSKDQLRSIRGRAGSAIKHPATGISAEYDEELLWQKEGECAGVPVEIFFPQRGESTKPAEKFCGQCAVKSQCLDYALESGVKHGIWGGVSERQRRQLRKEQGLEAAA